MTRILFIFIFSACLFHSYSQGFRTRYKEPHTANNSARAIFEISTGNYIGAGFATDTSSGYARSSLALMGLDALGQVQWVKKHHGGSIEYINNPFSRKSFFKQGNNLYFAGAARDSAGGNGRMFGVLIKYNLNGDTIWRKTYHGADSLEDVVPQMGTASVDGGFLMTGFFQHWGSSGSRPCLLIKTNVNGNELWRQQINKIGHNVSDGKAIIQDSTTKKIAIVGYQYIGTPNSFYASDHILVTDSVGTKLYQGKFSGSYGGQALDLIQTSDKKLLMVGQQFYQYSPQTFLKQKAFAVKFNINTPASSIWRIDQSHLVSNTDQFIDAIVLQNGNILIGGIIDSIIGPSSPSPLLSNTVAKFIVVDNNGNIKSKRYYDYYPKDTLLNQYHFLNSISLCSDNGWVTSMRSSAIPNPNPFFFIRYDSSGCDSTLEYCEMLASVGYNEKESLKNLISLFPNPFKNEINIEINNGHTISENLGFRITNLLGKTLIEGNLKVHLNNKPINLVELPSGVYFFEAVIDNRKYHSKILKE